MYLKLIEVAKVTFNLRIHQIHENACLPTYLLTLFDLWQNDKLKRCLVGILIYFPLIMRHFGNLCLILLYCLFVCVYAGVNFSVNCLCAFQFHIGQCSYFFLVIGKSSLFIRGISHFSCVLSIKISCFTFLFWLLL